MNLQQCLDFFVWDAEDTAVPLRPRLKRFEWRIRLLEVLHAAQQRKNADLAARQIQGIDAELPRSETLDRPVPVVDLRDLGRLESVRRRIMRPEASTLLRELEARAGPMVLARCHEIGQRLAKARGDERTSLVHDLRRALDRVDDPSWVPSFVHVKTFVTEVHIAHESAARAWLADKGYRPKRRGTLRHLRAFLGRLIDDGVLLPEGVIAVNISSVVTA
ncbi:MAG: hypothetical protein KF830_16655 [Planctomycetes bacterium]|nr:hypothetical protein [Planctomycetota bacterium]